MSVNTLVLAGMALNSQMVWTDRFTSQGVAQSVYTTLGGSPSIYSQKLIAGQSITLEAQETRGWLTKTMVDFIQELADSAGSVIELQINGEVTLVVFRHHEAPAFSADPIVPRLNQQPNDKFTATLKLMTV